MLRLDRLHLSGFKSFSDRTEVSFRDGITAVVGPNGCGKSNIGDAINWVLGEQSPRSLRGRQMADVIFNGSDARKPTGMAEVSLVLSGANGDPDNRISLTRRLFRSGDSEYLLNGQRARLKDIQEMLRRERVGAKTYATIEQGRIDQIINAKPRDLRLILEEAAGVAGFKHKRRLTELKLEATRANLLRVTDIVGEVRRQINSLKRQAQKARRYKRLREQLRERQALRFGVRAEALDRELQGKTAGEASAREAESAAAARVASLEAELAAERNAIDEADRTFRDSAERLHQLDLAVDRAESEVRVCRERIAESERTAERRETERAELATRRGTLAGNVEAQRSELAEGEQALGAISERLAAEQAVVDDVDRRVRDIRDTLEELRRRLFDAVNRRAAERNERAGIDDALARNRVLQERLRREGDSARGDADRLQAEGSELDRRAGLARERLERCRTGCSELERRLPELRERHLRSTEALAAAREEERSCGARLRTLEDVATRFAGASDGVRALLTRGEEQGIRTRGVFADYVEAGREVERAAEGYLGGLLPTVILEDDADARRAVELLRAEGAGRTAFVARSQPAGAVAVGSPGNGVGGAFPAELLEDARVLGSLRERLSLHTRVNGVLHERIGDALVVDSLETALELHRRHPAIDFLTRDGEVVYASGIVLAGGAAAGDDGLLAHNRRIQEAREQLRAAEARAAAEQRSSDEAQEARDALEAELTRARAELEEARHSRLEVELHAKRSTEDRERSRRRTDVIRQELAAAEAEGESLTRGRAECDARLRETESAHVDLERQLQEATAELERRESTLRERSEACAGLREQAAARRQSVEAARVEGDRLAEALRELDARIEAASREAGVARNEREATAARMAEVEADLLHRLEERERLGGRVGALEREIGERRRQLHEREPALSAERRGLDAAREATREAEMARARAEADRGHLDDLCAEELGIGAADAARLAGEEALAGADADALEQEIAEIRAGLDRIGPVNILAIDEYSELEERHTFLAAQQQDLETSMESLAETIRKINRSSRERFREAFDSVRGHYQEIFQTLFRGGRADMRLDEGEDVLEAGVQIFAQPPGKRLSSVQLLSGGERAMSAIALLFAIFRFRPSPFCLLDEVDAPLDDANIVRFVRMLSEYASQTQFVLITHNKLSMEAANLLYGVTMQEAGVSRIVSIELG